MPKPPKALARWSTRGLALWAALVAGCARTPAIVLADSGAKSLEPGLAEPREARLGSVVERSADRWGVRWCFGGGSPMAAAPALGPQGQVYVATEEGYVHALTANGAFDWSYTVKGAAVGGPVVQPDGSIVIATTLNLLYALRPNGTRFWVYRAPEPITTPLAVSERGSLVFGAGARSVYAVSSRGGLLWRVTLSAPHTTPPMIYENGTVFIGTQAGAATWQAPARRVLWPSPPVDGLALGSARAGAQPQLWLASGQMFSSNGAVPRVQGVLFLRRFDDGRALALTASELLGLSAEGAVERKVALDSEPSAEAVSGLEGDVFVPMVDGRILRVAANGEVEVHARLGFSEVSRLAVDLPRARLVAAVGEGQVCAVSLQRTPDTTG